MNDNRQRLSEAVGLLHTLAQTLMRAIRARPGRVSTSDLAELRRFEALARAEAISADMADSIAATRRALVRLDAARPRAWPARRSKGGDDARTSV